VTIGRRSASSGTTPDIDLGRPPADIGVSHAHAMLTQTADGGWCLTDQDSMNGTFLGDSDAALAPKQPVPVNEGDAIHVGAWTTITLRRI
jgi:predicted component of type VI protein secretion system